MAQFHLFILSKLEASVEIFDTDSTCLLNEEEESCVFFSKLIIIGFHEKSKLPAPITTNVINFENRIVEQNNSQQALLNLEDKETTLSLAYKKLSKKAAYKKKDVK